LRLRARPHWERDAPAAQPPATPRTEGVPHRKPLLAATPAALPFRQPDPSNINLNDPSTL
jgi:hypothetical protein